MIKIGFKDNHKIIPLSRVCYALYHEKQDNLFPEEEICFTDNLEELEWIENDVDAVGKNFPALFSNVKQFRQI